MPASKDQGKRYRAKRDFRRTPEPRGGGDSGSSEAPVFVVQVWDRGTYCHITGDDGDDISIDEALENGHVLIELDGKKLRGGYALHRTGSGGDSNWLLIKMKDAAADAR